ncbi:hypothetical protein C0J52_06961 [Blattella germanica]|nr:hypothetical protein C0J52_06961 [Blattella germanica]
MMDRRNILFEFLTIGNLVNAEQFCNPMQNTHRYNLFLAFVICIFSITSRISCLVSNIIFRMTEADL